MSKVWKEEVKSMSDEELIKDIENKMENMFYHDLQVSELLIRIIKKLNRSSHNDQREKLR